MNGSVRLEIVEDEGQESILHMGILWPSVEHSGRGSEGQSVSAQIQASQPPLTLQRYNPDIRGVVSAQTFDYLRDLYTNNQWACLKALGPPALYERESIIRELTKLECWFLQVIEPPTKDDPDGYLVREEMKTQNWRSFYCNEDLDPLIGDIPDSIKVIVATNYNTLTQAASMKARNSSRRRR